MHLAIFFAEQEPGFALMPPTELAAFRADDVPYRNTGAGYFTSLYDRLLDADERLIGFLLWCLPEQAGLGAALADLDLTLRPYLMPVHDSPRVYGLALRDLAPGEAEQLDGGGEQAFGGQIFRGDDGGVAVTIDLGYLFGDCEAAEADLNLVRAARAHWPVITGAVELSAA